MIWYKENRGELYTTQPNRLVKAAQRHNLRRLHPHLGEQYKICQLRQAEFEPLVSQVDLETKYQSMDWARKSSPRLDK